MNRFLKTTFSICVFLFTLGLNEHCADGLIEHSSYEEDKMAYEMELFRNYETMYQNCLRDYRKNNNLYHSLWNKIIQTIPDYYQRMKHVINDVKVEIMCAYMIYSCMKTGDDPKKLVIIWTVQALALEYSYVFLRAYVHHKLKGNHKEAKTFAESAAYLAAFGAIPSNQGTYEEMKYYTHKSVPVGEFGLLPDPYLDEDILFIEFMRDVRTVIFSNYNSQNKSFDATLSDLQAAFPILGVHARRIDSYLGDILLAKNPAWPGTKLYETEFNDERLWESKDLLEAIDLNNIPANSSSEEELEFKTEESGEGSSNDANGTVNEGSELESKKLEICPSYHINIKEELEMESKESYERPSYCINDGLREGSIVIHLLRAIELEKVNLHRLSLGKPRMKKEEIHKIKRGFKGQKASLHVQLLATKPMSYPTLLFSKYSIRRNHFSNTIANNERLRGCESQEFNLHYKIHSLRFQICKFILY